MIWTTAMAEVERIGEVTIMVYSSAVLQNWA
jgi:hypothetical protein